MIPRNERERADMAKAQRWFIARSRRQIEHLAALQEVERGRLARLEAELAAMIATPPAPNPRQQGAEG